MAKDEEQDDAKTNDRDDGGSNDTFQAEFQQRAVEVTRDSLERQNTQSFLKRRPRKLPYSDARRWVQANLGAATQEEFDDMVANGNLRTPYIPKRPEEYYTSTREWISWHHFLTNDSKLAAFVVKPQTGVFD